MQQVDCFQFTDCGHIAAHFFVWFFIVMDVNNDIVLNGEMIVVEVLMDMFVVVDFSASVGLELFVLYLL